MATVAHRKGSVVDIVPGSQLEAACGAQNLSGVLTGPQVSRRPRTTSIDHG
jgi:hypothetical protein